MTGKKRKNPTKNKKTKKKSVFSYSKKFFFQYSGQKEEQEDGKFKNIWRLYL